MDPDVIQDPVFQHLLLKLESSQRKLRDSVIALRSFYLTHHKRPLDDTLTEKWRSALLGEKTCQLQQKVEDAVGDLIRYGFEIMPNNNSPSHIEDIMKLKAAHMERLRTQAGWGESDPAALGFEEKVLIDRGPPITITIKPSKWDYTEKAKRAKRARKPAMDQESDPSPTDVDDAERGDS
jgi:hypothetical protein